MREASVWRRCIDAISTLIEEGTFAARQEGIKFRAIDPARISMVDFHLSSSIFEAYALEGERDIGVNLEDMSKFLRRARPGDRLGLSVDDQANRFVLRLEGLGLTTFSIPLLDLSIDTPPEIPVPYTAMIRIEAGVLSEVLRSVAVVGDHVQIRATPDFLRLEGEGPVENVDVRIEGQSQGVAHMEVRQESRAIYIISYIQNMLRAAEATDIIEMEFGDEAMPLKLKIPLEGGEISFLLAPRVED
jgi:proliferating cell nuclear antigen